MGKKPTYKELEERIIELERKKGSDSLSEELELLQSYLLNIINSMPSILIVVNKKLEVIQWNFQAELETGVREQDAKGKLLEDIFPRISRYIPLIRESIQFSRIKTRLKQDYFTGAETRFEDVILYPLFTKKQEGLVIRIDDTTDHVRLEEMITQSEKMLALGGLAAGMAHEINNPLAGMMQNSQVIRNRLAMDLPANETVAKEVGISMADIQAYARKRKLFDMLEMINDSGNQATKIIKEMLGFARKNDSVLKPYHLTDILQKTLAMAKMDFNLKKEYDLSRVSIIEDFDTNMPPVHCDKIKIQQVFFNLLKNGLQAMFTLKEKTYMPKFIFRSYQEGKMACIEIENNGPSIDKENKKRLFEPFFTTKSKGEGTGLGLSLSYFIIVNDHKGEMSMESSPERDTKFIIKLPY